MDHALAFLGAFVTSAVLSLVLAYIARVTALGAALDWWALGYALNAVRLLIYAVAGVSPPDTALFVAAEGIQVLQALTLLFGVLAFTGRPPSPARHILPAALGAIALSAAMAFAVDGGPLRVAPLYAVSGACLMLAGAEIVRHGRGERNAGFAFTAVVLVLWGVHKLGVLLPAAGIAPFRFMVSAGFYTAAALGFAIMALDAYHRRLSRGLSENEAHFRRMFDDAPVGYQSLDGEGRIVAVNRRWLDTLGYAPDEVIGRPFGEFLSPASRQTFPQRFARFKKTGVVQAVEFELLRKDGREIIGSFEGRINPGAEPGALRTHCVLTDVTERRRREALVTRLGRIIEQTFNEIFMFDADTLTFLHVNTGGVANTGYSLEELRRLTPLDLNPDFTRERFEALIAPLRRGERETLVFETRHRRKDGTTYDGEVRLQLMADETPPVFVAVIQDVSARKRTEAALREREGLLHAVMAHSPASIYVKDLEGRFILVNRAFERRNGVAAAEAIGRTSHDLQPTSQADDAVRRETLALDGGKTHQEEVEVEHPGGDRRVYLSAKFPVFDADGRLLGVGSVSTDMTESKRTARALSESESRLKAIMDHSPVAIALRDTDGRFLAANQEYLRRTNLALPDILGRTVREVETEAVADVVEAQEREVKASGEAGLFEARQKTAGGGDEMILAVVRFPVRDTEGAITGIGVVSMDVTEWKRTEEALRFSESRLQAIMDHAPAEITQKDRDGRFLLANRAYLRRRGVAAKDVIGKTVADFVPPDEAREIHAQDEEVMAGGRVRYYRNVRTRAGGGAGTFTFVSFPMLDEKGEVAGIGTIGIDVTREERTEQALRNNEERLRLVLESTGEGIYAVDTEGRCTLCNPAAARMLGYDDADDLLGRDIHALIHHTRADGRPYPLAECPAHRAIVEQAPAYVDDEVFWRRDGRPIPVAFRSNPAIRDGEVVGTVVSFSDIGARKRAEAWLLRLSQSVEQSPFGVAIADAEARFEYVNPSFSRETGYTLADLEGRTLAMQHADGPASASAREIGACLAGGGVWRGEVRHRRKTGEVYWASLLVSPIRDGNGRTVAHVSISEDITERRRMADHLRQAQKMEAVGQLTGGVAHDFNNILSVILASAECLAEDLKGEEEMASLVSAIVRSVHRAADLTERLLAFSRRQDLDPEVLDLSSVMGDMADLLRRSLGETIRISVETTAGAPPAVVDRGQFENALLNLAVNARDAMPGGGTLAIGIAPGDPPAADGGGEDRRQGDFVCVSVTDTGTGMPPEVAERIFEPFFTTKGKGRGTGLGLSMVYGFVRQSGGDIVVDSVENEGTTFRLYFPAAEHAVPAPAAPPKGEARDEAPLPPLTIVLAEDDGGVRTATKFILEGAGHRVLDAVNGVEALAVLKRTPHVDLLVTDVIMPGGLGGRDLAERARAIRPRLKVLFTSGYADGRLSEGDIVAGTTVFVPKPYTKESLIGAIRSLDFGD